MPRCCRVGGPQSSFPPCLLRGAALVMLLLSFVGMLVSGGKVRIGGPLSRVPGPQKRPPVPVSFRIPPCFHSILYNSNTRGPREQSRNLLNSRRNVTLFSRSKSISPRKRPPPLSASDLGGPSAGPIVSSVFLSRLSRLGRPLARKLLPQLSFNNPLMLPSGVGMTGLMQFVEQQKILHKEHVILTQVGIMLLLHL